MGIIITCDFCGKALEFGGDWRRVRGGRVACVPCQEIVLQVGEMEKLGRNLEIYKKTQIDYGCDTLLIDDTIILHKSLTNALQQVMLLSGFEF